MAPNPSSVGDDLPHDSLTTSSPQPPAGTVDTSASASTHRTNGGMAETADFMADLRTGLELALTFLMVFGGVITGFFVTAWSVTHLIEHGWPAGPIAIPGATIGLTVTLLFPIAAYPAACHAAAFVFERRARGSATYSPRGGAHIKEGSRGSKVLIAVVGCLIVTLVLLNRKLERQNREIEVLRTMLNLVRAEILELKNAM